MFSSRAKKSPRRWSFNYESCFNVEFSFSLAAKEQIGQADVFLQIDSPEKGWQGEQSLHLRGGVASSSPLHRGRLAAQRVRRCSYEESHEFCCFDFELVAAGRT